MYLIIIAILNNLMGAFYNIKWKQFRLNDMNPRSAIGIFSFALPFWMIGLLYAVSNNKLYFSKEYVFAVLIWSILVILGLQLSIYVVKFLSLSGLNMYRFALSTSIGLIIDLFFFKTVFHIFTIISIFLFFLSGLLLTNNKQVASKPKNSTVVIILIVLTLIRMIQFSAYKYAVMMQPNKIFHVCFIQSVLYSLYLVFNHKSLFDDIRKGIIKKSDLLIFTCTILINTIFEAYLFNQLPIVVILLLSTITLVIYSLYDISSKEMKVSLKLVFGMIFAIFGIILLYFSKLL